ncbi:ArpU family transcriptional regulator [Bacillus cereus]|uniref:ArpU family phage packaging/lysis transcriptional regulator n=1 Tax=Bacillales TaxID=1385 RepID=UPI00065C0651|nr:MULTISPECIES: ArpU family phage packaging/lysis transcriptional regulator [Bacillales]WAI29920.1 MAG: ArpU family transcriptional regulator [Bacillus paranthracis]KMP32210.1 ArpU family transcriptional regulator [Bacillus cereus]MBK3312607.1 ArpU family transcriptional regulator [Staphylococcus aureus]OJD90290.1 ArpU family transcriptional regulator [Bacillus cereus]WAI35765.1 MAG: ArpU family transcriptional regulator [Bacillus paranthracis]
MERQLTLLPAIDKETEKKVQKEVVSILKEYRALKVCSENKAEQQQEGISLFPEIRDTKHVNQIKLRQVERALMHSLDEDEVKIIEMKYLSNKKLKDDFIYNELLIKKDAFYEKKKNAIRLIATALGMI